MDEGFLGTDGNRKRNDVFTPYKAHEDNWLCPRVSPVTIDIPIALPSVLTHHVSVVTD